VEAGLRCIEKKRVETVCLGSRAEKPSITKRIDNITEIRGEYLTEVPPCPESVKIELTALCNFSCTFCARSQHLREVGHIDRDFFERILVDLLRSGVQELGLFYLGESFLVPWLPEAIRYAKELGFPYVFLTTNGSVSTPDKVEACLEAGLDSLKFSFNYSDPDHFASITKKPASQYAGMVSNLKSAWRVREEGGYTCGVYASYIMFEGERQREKMTRVVEEIEDFTDEVYALPLYSQAAHIEQENGTRWVFTGGNPGRYDKMRAPIPCWALGTTRCAPRSPAGPSSPKAISRGTAGSARAASITTDDSTWGIWNGCPSWTPGTRRNSASCGSPISVGMWLERSAKSASRAKSRAVRPSIAKGTRTGNRGSVRLGASCRL
jgi:hypothetical protein